MFMGTREIKWAILSAALTLILIGAFQNCAPSLPDNEVRQLGGASIRPTPLPSATPLPAIGDTVYGALPWEGTCTNDFATEDMAVQGLDIALAPLMVYRRASDNAVALWNFNYQKVQRGVVCKFNGAGWSVKGKGDFNGDGNTDILWRNTDGRTAIWLLRGSTRINGGFSTNQLPVWNLEATGDFNRDGKADILWRNTSTNRIEIWYMNGATVSSVNPLLDPSGAMLPVDPKYRIEGTGDFNADGKADVLLVDKTTNQAYEWLMDGAKITTAAATNFNIGAGWNVLGVGDFDADGRADISWFNPTTLAIMNWKMDGITRTEGVATLAMSGWTPEFTVDATGDFRADIIWTIPNTQIAMQVLAITPVSVNPVAGSSASYNPVRAGWASFKFDRL